MEFRKTALLHFPMTKIFCLDEPDVRQGSIRGFITAFPDFFIVAVQPVSLSEANVQ